MDSGHFAIGAIGFLAGWIYRSFNIEKPEQLPCKCECACATQASGESSGPWGGQLALCALVIGVCIIAGNAVLACKVTFVNRGGEQEVAFSVKGRSKGVINPAKGFQITQG